MQLNDRDMIRYKNRVEYIVVPNLMSIRGGECCIGDVRISNRNRRSEYYCGDSSICLSFQFILKRK